MRKVRNRSLLVVSVTLATLGAAIPLSATVPPDTNLFTTYSINTAHTTVSFVVCGRLPGSSGCFGSGSLGPFGKVGALIEGNQTVNLTTNTVTRDIYVLDLRDGTTSNGVDLFVYKKTDAISSTFDTVSVTLVKTVELPILGGSSALAFMAANANFLFMGTNQSPNAIVMNKSNFTFTQAGGFSPPINVAGITSDKYGYVTITYGSFKGGESAFFVFGPDGSIQEDGGGAPFMLSTDQAVLPSTLP